MKNSFKKYLQKLEIDKQKKKITYTSSVQELQYRQKQLENLHNIETQFHKEFIDKSTKGMQSAQALQYQWYLNKIDELKNAQFNIVLNNEQIVATNKGKLLDVNIKTNALEKYIEIHNKKLDVKNLKNEQKNLDMLNLELRNRKEKDNS